MTIRTYNAPPSNPSSIGPQIRVDDYLRKAIIDKNHHLFFLRLSMPCALTRNHGKVIKANRYIPIMDDRNINTQGIDPNGVELVLGTWNAYNSSDVRVTTGAGARPDGSFSTEAQARTAAGARGFVSSNGGNILGSSDDISSVANRVPYLGERGGKVNRTGLTRIVVSGSIQLIGFHDSFSAESEAFDTDTKLYSVCATEMVNAAAEISDQLVQYDLLHGAGTLRYGGTAVSRETVSGNVNEVSEFTSQDFIRMDSDLNNNKTPTQTSMLTGSNATDTRTVSEGRFVYISSDLVPALYALKDDHGDGIFVQVRQYGGQTTKMAGEIGSIYNFRFIVVPDMLTWRGKGKKVGTNAGYRETAGYYDVYPMLMVGSDSFKTMTFQMMNNKSPYNMKVRKPFEDNAYSIQNPFGSEGFRSVQWYHGTVISRSERIAIMHTVART